MEEHMNILQKPAAMLEQQSLQVYNFVTKKIQNTIDFLFKEMKKANDAGIAAVQLGILEQIFVYGFEHNPRYPNAPPVPETYMINFTIIWSSQETSDFEEGCLSVPGQRFLITRPSEIKIEYYDTDGNLLIKHASEFEARVIQHEMDHLNGITILERKDMRA